VNNVIVGEEITRAAGKVQSGKALSAALEHEDYILLMVPQMIKIGEQSGKIDEMMGKTAQVYEDELDEQIKAISTMIEPALMVVLAVFAGGLIGAILYPIYGLLAKIRLYKRFQNSRMRSLSIIILKRYLHSNIFSDSTVLDI